MKKLVAVFAIVVTLLTAVPAMADFYVIPVGTRYKHPEVVSAYRELSPTPQNILTVPAGKTFILTDIVSEGTDKVYISEDASLKTKIQFDMGDTARSATPSCHFNSGIPFASGTDVRGNTGSYTTGVTVSGYLIDN